MSPHSKDIVYFRTWKKWGIDKIVAGYPDPDWPVNTLSIWQRALEIENLSLVNGTEGAKAKAEEKFRQLYNDSIYHADEVVISAEVVIDDFGNGIVDHRVSMLQITPMIPNGGKRHNIFTCLLYTSPSPRDS